MDATPPVIKRPALRWRVSLDTILIIFAASMVISSYVGWLTPYRQGFHCDDAALNYQFHGDTISLGVLLSLVIITPMIFIILIEIKRHRIFAYLHKKDDALAKSSEENFTVFRKCCLQVYMSYFYGLICAIILVEFLKLTIGGLRPHFFYSCRPDYTSINCSEGFITNYTCTNKGNMSILYYSDIFKSFPSGHAALSVHMSIYLCFYIHKQLFPWPTYLSAAMVQVFLLFWAGYCSISRMLDHRHHWWDVMFGALVGVVCACYSAMWLWWKPLPCCKPSLISPLSNGSRRSYESNSVTRRLLSSQASQTTELGESLSLRSATLEFNHISVQAI